MGWANPRVDYFTEISCGECGIQFCVPEDWRADKQRTGKGWHCPNGHGRVYKETTEAKLKRELEAVHRDRDWQKQRAESADRARKQAEGKLRGLKKRVAAGVCPCCQRTVSQLARHMKTKHPDFPTE